MRRLLVALILCVPLSLYGQYQMPPKAIADVVDAPPSPQASVSPDGNWLVLMQQPPLLTIADLSQPELKLAGVRFNPETHDQPRQMYSTSLTLMKVIGGQSRPAGGLPPSARIRFVTWSPDSQHIAFTLSRGGVELWVADVATGNARRLSNLLINQSLPRRPYEWMPDSRSIVARTVAMEGPPPEPARTPSGPAVQESRARKAPARTYEDLLRDESDAALFEYHMQSRLMRIQLTGEATRVGPQRGMIVRHLPSPDGRFIEVETVHRPFSYTVPVDRFPRRIEIWATASAIARVLADLPLADQVPTDRDSVRTGPRDVQWRADKPSTLVWAEAQDGGNPKKDVPYRDAIFTLTDLFGGSTPVKLMDVPMRYAGIEWGNDSVALVQSQRWRDRRIQTWQLRPNASAAAELLFDRSSEDRYSDPGDPVLRTNAAGQDVLRIASDGRSLYYIGEGASPEGARPFLSRLDLKTKKTTRLFRSDAPYYEMPVHMLDDRGGKIITRRESVSEPPNWIVRDLRRRRTSAITSIPNPTPQLANVKKEVIHYKRRDGIDLNGTLYLPPGYDAQRDGPLPVLMWAYPQEFKSAAAAGQVTTSPYRFIRVTGTGSPIVFVLRGYAVLDNPTIPIVGEGSAEPNDTYVDQLVAGAQAAVDELVRRGAGDRKRMAIAGHSYGAFMTANLLAHSDLFRAGIARSGAYNRTLTPFSFQSEERTYWQAPEIYTKMSPFTYADKINEPLLLIHGIDDDNSGTFPIQSERLYQALSGLGGTVRLVMLPKEAHGYRGRESVMHVLWETDQWLEKYVKNAK